MKHGSAAPWYDPRARPGNGFRSPPGTEVAVVIEMELRSIKISDTGDRQYIGLSEKTGERSLTIVIGYAEVLAIHRFVKSEQMPRPMTHDLLVSTLEASGAALQRVDVTDLRDGTFYAVLRVRRQDGTDADVDARPSDAIALATALKKPIYVAEQVLRDAAIP
jgi:bifunctional DNase/RNase